MADDMFEGERRESWRGEDGFAKDDIPTVLTLNKGQTAVLRLILKKYSAELRESETNARSRAKQEGEDTPQGKHATEMADLFRDSYRHVVTMQGMLDRSPA